MSLHSHVYVHRIWVLIWGPVGESSSGIVGRKSGWATQSTLWKSENFIENYGVKSASSVLPQMHASHQGGGWRRMGESCTYKSNYKNGNSHRQLIFTFYNMWGPWDPHGLSIMDWVHLNRIHIPRRLMRVYSCQSLPTHDMLWRKALPDANRCNKADPPSSVIPGGSPTTAMHGHRGTSRKSESISGVKLLNTSGSGHSQLHPLHKIWLTYRNMESVFIRWRVFDFVRQFDSWTRSIAQTGVSHLIDGESACFNQIEYAMNAIMIN